MSTGKNQQKHLIIFQRYLNHYQNKKPRKHTKKWNVGGVPNIINIVINNNNKKKSPFDYDEVLNLLQMVTNYELGGFTHITVDGKKNIDKSGDEAKSEVSKSSADMILPPY